LVPIDAPDNALILTSAAPGKINDDSKGRCSVLVAELLNNLNVPAADAEAVFNKDSDRDFCGRPTVNKVRQCRRLCWEAFSLLVGLAGQLKRRAGKLLRLGGNRCS
jgi:hypothetical protein